VISEFLFTAPTLNLAAWHRELPGLPLYAGIQPEWKGSSANSRHSEFPLGALGYRQIARQRWQDGADGIYLFNFFTSREWPDPTEPPFEVVTQLGDRPGLEQSWRRIVTGSASGGYAAFPDVCRAANGDLLCVFYSGYGHVATPNAEWPRGGRILSVRSTDNGASWSTPTVVADTVHDDRDPHIAAMPDGSLVCNWFAAANPKHPFPDQQPLALFLNRSRDHGKTWSEPESIPIPSPKPFASSAPIRPVSDGSWILGIYTENDKTQEAYGATLRSLDQGKTWQDLAPIGEHSGFYLDAETDVIPLRDGRLLAALRSSKTDLYLATSTDQGKHWSDVESSGFRGHSPHFLRHSSGLILLSHRLPNTAIHWSRDEGKTWQGPLEIDGVIGAYPSCVELPNGDVLCVYYEEGKNSGIRSTRLRVREGAVQRLSGDW
jgi:predicted neuraminidase